ncbi:ATP-binding protein [Paraburkholderia strydomiana]|uniref:ATP-binding protein n=1 Tax=Paraburkholderia strydomiana TaxID=1245417 RepID=UPI0038BC1B9B
MDDFLHRFKVAATLYNSVDDAGVTSFAASALYRIVHEALTNVTRHAQASEAVVKVSSDADTCRIRIEDNGRGTVIDDAGKPDSFGLLGMGERVRQLNDTLTIDSVPGKGFRITARIPLNAIRPDAKPPV